MKHEVRRYKNYTLVKGVDKKWYVFYFGTLQCLRGFTIKGAKDLVNFLITPPPSR